MTSLIFARRFFGSLARIGLQLVEQLAKGRIDALFMSQSAQSRALTTPGTGAANWHVRWPGPNQGQPPLQRGRRYRAAFFSALRAFPRRAGGSE